MSWLKDLAGQAEGLLNQLDQSAGEVLVKSPSRPGSVHSARISPTRALTVQHEPSSSQPSKYKSSGYASSVSSYKKADTDQDQQLLEFLNEDKPSLASHSRKSSSSSIHSVPAFLQSLVSAPEPTPTATPPKTPVSSSKADPEGARNPVRQARLEREIIELKAREIDLTKAMQAKDSQLAVLRVRLQEADQQVQSKTKVLTGLKEEKERLLRDSADSSQVRDAALTTLQDQLAEAQSELEREKTSARRAESEYRNRIQQLETEQGQLAHQLTEVQKISTEQQLKSSESVETLRLAKYNLEANKKEFDEYKQKAQRILEAKEKLIVTLKSGGEGGEGETELELRAECEELRSERDLLKDDIQQAQHTIYNLRTEIQGGEGETELELRAECEELRSERDLLKDDTQQAQHTIYNLRTEIQEVESSLASEQRASLETQRELQEAVQSAQMTGNHYQDQLHHLQKEHQILQDELRRQQMSVQKKLQEKDSEIHRLMTVVSLNLENTGRSTDVTGSGNSVGESEARIRGLTESLIQKQMTIESLQTEKNNLNRQLERMEKQYMEAEAAAIRHVSIPMEEGGGSAGSRVPPFLRESPYDSGVARGVKRAYEAVHGAEAAAIRHVSIPMEEGGGSAGSRVPQFLRESPYDSGVARGVKHAYGGLDTMRSLPSLQKQYMEAEAAAIRHVSIMMEEGGGSAGSRVPPFLRESPYDSGVARGVKCAYGGLDTMSVKVGVFLRRYPAARSFLFLYIILLHLWVMVVLLTYSPEMHSADYHPQLPPTPRE